MKCNKIDVVNFVMVRDIRGYHTVSTDAARAMAGISKQNSFHIKQVLSGNSCFRNYLHAVTRSKLNPQYLTMNIQRCDARFHCSYRRVSLAANRVTHHGRQWQVFYLLLVTNSRTSCRHWLLRKNINKITNLNSNVKLLLRCSKNSILLTKICFIVSFFDKLSRLLFSVYILIIFFLYLYG